MSSRKRVFPSFILWKIKKEEGRGLFPSSAGLFPLPSLPTSKQALCVVVFFSFWPKLDWWLQGRGHVEWDWTQLKNIQNYLILSGLNCKRTKELPPVLLIASNLLGNFSKKTLLNSKNRLSVKIFLRLDLWHATLVPRQFGLPAWRWHWSGAVLSSVRLPTPAK